MKASKFFALILAVLMLSALIVPSFAEGELAGHSYAAYQIFSGTQAAGDSKLAGIQWGSGINGEDFLAELNKLAAYADCKTAEDVARIVSTYADESDAARAFAKLAYEYKSGNGTFLEASTVLDAGYYLVVDITTFGPDETDTVYNLALLQLTQKGPFEIAQKVSVPEIEKEVYEESLDEWRASADYDIGDSVPFRLTATIGDIAGYETYKIIFHDTMTKGLNFDRKTPVSVVLYHGEKKTEILPGVNPGNYSLDISNEDRTLELTIKDLVCLGAQKGDTVVVIYHAILNDQAVIGVEGNPNKAYLEYDNNPNDESDKTTGKTPESEVKVYTWGTHVDKITEIDGKPQPLAGAKFELFKKDANNNLSSCGEVEVKEVKNEKGEIVSYTACFDGLDSGTYVLRETVVPKGYNGIEDIEFTITVTFDGEDVKEFSVDNEFIAQDGIVYGEILNKVGIVLPETGGMGTTIFYALGAILLVGGIVLLITKKRVEA